MYEEMQGKKSRIFSLPTEEREGRPWLLVGRFTRKARGMQ
jgi:hypothetical protein